MDPSTEAEPQEAKPLKWCWFSRWIRQKQQPARPTDFASGAQAALDSAKSPRKSINGHGTLYRAGLTLADLKPGECGTVRRLFGPALGRLRLLEMGLTPGTHIRMLRTAAFGGPLDILVRGYQLSLRRDEAAGVWLDDPDDDAETGLSMTAAAAPPELGAGGRSSEDEL